METLLERSFGKMGARVKERSLVPRRNWTTNSDVGFITLDVRRDGRGEFFDIRLDPASYSELQVLDVQAKERHLLLMARRTNAGTREKHKFLCGHDERNWFVAAIPEKAAVSTVRQAMVALKPEEVVSAEARLGLCEKQARRRRNPAFVRQGEWFFVPAPRFVANEKFVLRNEPLSRGNGSKAHLVDECVRAGGETVYVSSRYPSGVDQETYSRIVNGHKNARTWGWRVMRRNAEVYVRGRIRHVDHKTVQLSGWHRVFMNTENQSVAMSHVVFLD